MSFDLTGRTAIISGSTAGIGRAVADALGKAGAQIVVTGRNADRVDAARRAVLQGSSAPDPIGISADLMTAEGATRLTSAVPDADILVMNLGLFTSAPLFDLEDDDWLQAFNANVLSATRLARHYAPRMMSRGWGRLIFVSSQMAHNVPTDFAPYAAAKAAIQAISRAYAKELAGSGVTSNVVVPGLTRTASALAALGTGETSPDAIERAYLRDNPGYNLIGRIATPEEVANLCLYLASPLSSATTGAALRVEGGIIDGIT